MILPVRQQHLKFHMQLVPVFPERLQKITLLRFPCNFFSVVGMDTFTQLLHRFCKITMIPFPEHRTSICRQNHMCIARQVDCRNNRIYNRKRISHDL